MLNNLPRHIVWMCSFLLIFGGRRGFHSVVPRHFACQRPALSLKTSPLLFSTRNHRLQPGQRPAGGTGAVKIRNGEVLGEKTGSSIPSAGFLHVQKVHNITPKWSGSTGLCRHLSGVSRIHWRRRSDCAQRPSTSACWPPKPNATACPCPKMPFSKASSSFATGTPN